MENEQGVLDFGQRHDTGASSPPSFGQEQDVGHQSLTYRRKLGSQEDFTNALCVSRTFLIPLGTDEDECRTFLLTTLLPLLTQK